MTTTLKDLLVAKQPNTGRFEDSDGLYFRYEGYEYADIEAFRIVKRTECGVWIHLGYGVKDKFILNGARKRYAYPTKADALESYRIRKLRQIEHCREGERRAIQGLNQVGFNAEDELKRFFREDFDWGG